jgi:anti-sigma factor RsiW
LTDRQGPHPLDLLAELALGGLDETEAAGVERHVAGCATCAAELAELRRVVQFLPYAGDDLAPRPALREALLSRIADEGQEAATPAGAPSAPRRGIAVLHPWRWAGAAAAAAIGLVVAGAAFGYALRAPGAELQREAGRGSQLAQAAVEGTLFVTRAEHDGARAAVVRAAGSREAYVWVAGLPPLPAGKAYQAWFTRDGQTFEPSAVFTGAAAWAAANDSIDGYAALGLTIEDADGAQAPTMAPIVVVDLTRTVRLLPR